MKVIVEIKGFVDPLTGMVINFNDLKKEVNKIIDKLDHKNLNLDVDDYIIDTSTCENTALTMFKDLLIPLPNLHRIVLYESPTSSSELTRKMYDMDSFKLGDNNESE